MSCAASSGRLLISQWLGLLGAVTGLLFEPLIKAQGKALKEQCGTTAALTRRSPNGGSLEIARQWSGFSKAVSGWFLGWREVPEPLLKVPPMLPMTGHGHLVPLGFVTCTEQHWSLISISCSKLLFCQRNTKTYGLTPREAWSKNDASPVFQILRNFRFSFLNSAPTKDTFCSC